jgi:hypothetical protein
MLGFGTPSTDGASITQMTNPRYRLLWTLKEVVWRRFGWAATITPIPTTITDYRVPGYTFGVHKKTIKDKHNEKDHGLTSQCPHATQGKSYETFNMPCTLQSFGTLNSSDDGETSSSDKQVHLDDLGSQNLLTSVNWDSWIIDLG